MTSRSPARAGALAAGLVGLVLGLDLLWSVVAGSTATTEFAAVDEPAHLATCLLFLLALLTLAGSSGPTLEFLAAAAVASVAIDLDHIPGLLGWHGLARGVPRPYTHSLLSVLALTAIGALARGRARPIAFGAASGVAAHLFRDLCTGPGVALWWPVPGVAVRLPYAIFVAGLVVIAVAVVAAAARGRSRSKRPGGPRATSPVSRLLAGFAAVAIAATLTVAPARAAGQSIGFGAYIPKADQHPALIDSLAQQVGRKPVIVSSYVRWRSPPFARGVLRAAWRRGAVPLITWEPWTLAGRGFPLAAIARGRYDAYLRRAARSAAAWGRPILLRFAHEMNGTWYPWGQGPNGNTPGVYKAAWRHLVRIFRATGAGNVEWVWSPNVDGGGQYPFERFFPGNRWVDWAGLDGFNWARRGEWQSFTEIFGGSYNTLSRLTSRPVIVAETGSSQSGGDKAAWVSSALRREVPRFSGIRAVVWFSDRVGDVDFRIDSSPAALRAFRSGISSRRYDQARGALLSTPSSPRHPGAAPSPPTGGFGEPSLLYRLTQKLHGRYLWMAIAGLVAFAVVLALGVALLRRTRRARRTAPPRPGGRSQAGGSEP